MKPINLKSSTYILTSLQKTEEKEPKFKVGDHVRISKRKDTFAKGYVPNLSKRVIVIKKVKNTVTWTYVISDLSVEEIAGTFYEKEL